jgi:ATP-dependent DNA helicase RecG
MPAQSNLFETPIQFAKGVGPRRARLLEKLGIRTLEDAFWFLPWRYENRLEVLPIKNLLPGMKATIQGQVQNFKMKTSYRRRLAVATISVRDETGLIECVFFNQPYLEKIFIPGVPLLLTGLTISNLSGSTPLALRGPEYEILNEAELQEKNGGRIIPVYHETNGLSSKQIRRIIRCIFDTYASDLQDILPKKICSQLKMPAFPEALRCLHFPQHQHSVDELNQQTSSWHSRLAFEEVFLLQLALAIRRKRQSQDTEGIAFDVWNPSVETLQSLLPFMLTPAQERVIQEISRDMARPTRMNRLLQGDVGCGKTVVALHAIVMACGSGYQAVLMAPTEVLSEQHYLSLSPLFESLGMRCLLLKGGATGRERAEILADIASGQVQVVVGTHALLQTDVQFSKLGLVIVDEQHKFGVLQRGQLQEKADRHPDVLIMTATPIPRTLAMTLYGDLDVSVIDQHPPGKKSIKTVLFPTGLRKKAHRLLWRELEAGRQAYVVYPLVEPSEKIDLQAAIEATEYLRNEFSPFRIGLLHGRLPFREKQDVMRRFKKKEIDVLVATTVVEVGLDIPNATIMLIEHAERFGLSQLHQLRGRIGRGMDQGYCILIHALGKFAPGSPQLSLKVEARQKVTEGITPFSQGEAFSRSTARRRLEVFVQCEDGFALAEEDLNIRGPGHVLGVKQWGGINFRVADVARDIHLMIEAKQMAADLLTRDPTLTFPEHHMLKETLFRKWSEKFSLGSIG